MKTCFFIGHHDTPLSLQEELDAVVMHLVKKSGGNSAKLLRRAVRLEKKGYLHTINLYHPPDDDEQ